MKPPYWNEAKLYLKQACPTMGALIDAYPGEAMTSRGDAFYTLLRSIVGQQISVKAADAVWGRLEARVVPLTPAKMLRVRDTTLRAVGLSTQKTVYVKELARYFSQPHVTGDFFAALDDESIIRELTSVKGIGRWTVEMFLIFHLGRPDVYPLLDLGMVKAIEKHYAGGGKLSREALAAHGERWRPYRTVATWYLWRALDPVPVSY